MTTLYDIQKLINSGESETLEFKSSFNNETIETLVAFANTSGGRVLIGINNKNGVVGVNINEESVQNWINEIKSKTTPTLIPDVNIVTLEDKSIVIFTVPEYPIKPVATRGKYFKRAQNSNHQMSLTEVVNEHMRITNSSWDYLPDPNHSLQHISVTKIEEYIKEFEHKNSTIVNYDPLEFLRKQEILHDDKLTFGAYLLFVKDYCSISDIQIGRFKSDISIIDTVSLNTDLLTELDEIINFIKKHLMVELIITADPQHQERYDYPLEAIREIVINMIVHRDYRSSNGSIIKIYDDRIEFYNPGGLFGDLTLEKLLKFNYTSQTRNKLIAQAFREIGIIEKYGSGIKRIFSICNDYGIIPPIINPMKDSFEVVLYKEKVNEGVNEGVNKLYEIIKIYPGNRTPFFSKKISTSTKNIERWIKELKLIDKIEFKGTPKTGGYYIK